MGRRKIAIQPIAHERNRAVTFAKRKHGLFKKAYELGVLCSVDVAVIIFEERPGHPPKLYQYCSSRADDVVRRHLHHDGEKESRGPTDFIPASGRKYEDVEVEHFDYVPRTISYAYQSPAGHPASTIHRQHSLPHLPYDLHQHQRERQYYNNGDVQRGLSSYTQSIPQTQSYANVYQSDRISAQYQHPNSHIAQATQPSSYPSPQTSTSAQGSDYSQASRTRSFSSASSSGDMYPPPREGYRSLDRPTYPASRSMEDYVYSETRCDPHRTGTSSVSSGRAEPEWPPPRGEQHSTHRQRVESIGNIGRRLERERQKSSEDLAVETSPSIERETAPVQSGSGVHWLDFLAGGGKSSTNGDMTTATRGVGLASVGPRSVSWESESSSGSRGGTSSRDETMAVNGLALFDLHGG